MRFYAEVTDTFGGEANYCWIRRYQIQASTFRGAINKLARHEGLTFRNVGNYSDLQRYDAKGACICAFLEYLDADNPDAVSAFSL